MSKLLNKIEALRENQLYSLQRYDEMVIAVTDDVKKIPLMISEENSGIDVKIKSVSFKKHNYTYEIEALLIEDGENTEDHNTEEFTLSIVCKY